MVVGDEATCCLCGRTGPAGTLHTCLAEGCAQLICRTCSDVRGRQYCHEHYRDLPAPPPAAPAQPGKEDQPGKARASQSSPGEAGKPGSPRGAGKLAPPATLPDLAGLAVDWEYLRSVRTTELNVLSRFQQNVELRSQVVLPAPRGEPDGRSTFSVRDWSQHRSLSEETAKVRRLFPANVSLRDIRTSCPSMGHCRYSFPAQGLVLEMQSCASLEALVTNGPAAAPLTTADLLEAVNTLTIEARRAGAQIVAGLFSPTGWEAGAVEQIVGTPEKPALVHPLVSICLVGPKVFDVVANPTDRRMAAYLPCFCGLTLAEESARCKEKIVEELYARDRAFLNACVGKVFRPEAIDLAVKDLLAERKDIDLVQVEEAGPTLKWRK